MSDQEIKDLLYNEVLVDCKGEVEANMSWFYYVQDEMDFPFEAEIVFKKINSKKVTQKINVVGLANDESNFDRTFDLKVEVELNDFLIEVPLAKLDTLDDSGINSQIIEAWKYWIKH